eukprot:GHVR01155883.1.p1 GENE.GHVR01155883.1~~GHVR01155883.1.p1  ORF type:complete len:236 (+),score=18.97 GHVR01155883.1:45-752(+)
MSSRLDNISRLIYLTNRLRKTGRNTSQSDAINKFSKRMIANSKPVPLTDNTVIPKPSKRVNYRDNRATVISIVSTGISTSIGDEISSGMCLPPICRNSQSSINPTIRLGEVISQLGIRTTRRSSVPSNARLCSDFSSAELAKFHRVCVGIVALWSAGVVKSLASPSVIESLPRVLPRKKCALTLDAAMTRSFGYRGVLDVGVSRVYLVYLCVIFIVFYFYFYFWFVGVRVSCILT